MEELDRHSVALAQNLEHFDIYRRRRCKRKPTRFFWQNETRFFQTCGHRSFPWIQSFASGWGVERLQERFLMAFHQSFWADLPRLWHSGSIFSTLPTSSGTFHLGKHMWAGPKSLRSKLTLLWMWFTNDHTDIATCAVNLWSVYGCIWCVWTTHIVHTTENSFIYDCICNCMPLVEWSTRHPRHPRDPRRRPARYDVLRCVEGRGGAGPHRSLGHATLEGTEPSSRTTPLPLLLLGWWGKENKMYGKNEKVYATYLSCEDVMWLCDILW